MAVATAPGPIPSSCCRPQAQPPTCCHQLSSPGATEYPVGTSHLFAISPICTSAQEQLVCNCMQQEISMGYVVACIPLTLTAYQQADAAYHLSAMCLLPHSCGLSAHLLPNVCCPMGKIDHRLCYITCHLLSILLAAQHLLPWWAAQHLPQSTPESKQCHLQD